MGHDDVTRTPDEGVGQGCHVRNAIIDRNVTLGEHVRIVNAKGVEEADHDLYAIRSGIVVIPRGTHIPANMTI